MVPVYTGAVGVLVAERPQEAQDVSEPMPDHLATVIRSAGCPECGHSVLKLHRDKCRWRPGSESPAAEELAEATPLSMSALLGPECECLVSDADALARLLLPLVAQWADEKFARMCNDPEWAGQEPSMGFQATFSQALFEDH
jgi:hypothetical protein